MTGQGPSMFLFVALQKWKMKCYQQLHVQNSCESRTTFFVRSYKTALSLAPWFTPSKDSQVGFPQQLLPSWWQHVGSKNPEPVTFPLGGGQGTEGLQGRLPSMTHQHCPGYCSVWKFKKHRQGQPRSFLMFPLSGSL